MRFWTAAAVLAWTAVVMFRRRQALELMIAADRFSFNGDLVPRADVAVVRPYKDLTFKGVRVDLAHGRWLAISASPHDRDDGVRAFSAQGYPVEGQ